MQSIKEVLEKGPKVSNWQNSSKTREMVSAQIAQRWGKSEVKNYNPEKNALPFSTWVTLGYRPKRGSKALTSVTYIEKKDAKGKVVSKYPRKINLFYYRDIEKIEPTRHE